MPSPLPRKTEVNPPEISIGALCCDSRRDPLCNHSSPPNQAFSSSVEICRESLLRTIHTIRFRNRNTLDSRHEVGTCLPSPLPSSEMRMSPPGVKDASHVSTSHLYSKSVAPLRQGSYRRVVHLWSKRAIAVAQKDQETVPLPSLATARSGSVRLKSPTKAMNLVMHR